MKPQYITWNEIENVVINTPKTENTCNKCWGSFKCHWCYGTVPNNKTTETNDAVFLDDDIYTKYKDITWKPSDGVSPTMLNYICEKLKITCYAFDITNKCFLKAITKNRNYEALVYYCVNNHMYIISDKSDVLKLTAQARDIETKIKSSIFPRK